MVSSSVLVVGEFSSNSNGKEEIMDYKKYVKINDNIIVFGAQLSHSHFKSMNPTSAGFIDIRPVATPDGIASHNIKFTCYGKSHTLDISSDSEEDTKLANIQLRNDY